MREALASFGPLGLLHLALFLVLLPWSAVRHRHRLQPPAPAARGRYFARVVVQLVIFGSIAAFVAWDHRIAWWTPPVALVSAAAWSAGLVALLWLACHPYRVSRVADPSTRALVIAPARAQAGWWVLVSLAAGVAEELAYRGVATTLLVRAGLPFAAVAIVVALAFGLAHAPRGWGHVAISAGIGLTLSLLTLATGSLLPAMAVHTGHDLLAGPTYGRLLRRAGAI